MRKRGEHHENTRCRWRYCMKVDETRKDINETDVMGMVLLMYYNPKNFGQPVSCWTLDIAWPLQVIFHVLSDHCHLCHLWFFLAAACYLRTKWCRSSLPTLKSFPFPKLTSPFPPSPTNQIQPNLWFLFPLGGGHFSQERSSNHCRCLWSLNSWGWWQEKDIFWETGEAPFILTLPKSFNILYLQILVWLA